MEPKEAARAETRLGRDSKLSAGSQASEFTRRLADRPGCTRSLLQPRSVRQERLLLRNRARHGARASARVIYCIRVRRAGLTVRLISAAGSRALEALTGLLRWLSARVYSTSAPKR